MNCAGSQWWSVRGTRSTRGGYHLARAAGRPLRSTWITRARWGSSPIPTQTRKCDDVFIAQRRP
jgi:hypothetical protein